MEALQLLSKNEMRNIKGGVICRCTYEDCYAELNQGGTSWTLFIEWGTGAGEDQGLPTAIENYNGDGTY
ncbi:MAG: hypothetical protein WD512_04220, partial [Candidatus Paceibacterota bacterium]